MDQVPLSSSPLPPPPPQRVLCLFKCLQPQDSSAALMGMLQLTGGLRKLAGEGLSCAEVGVLNKEGAGRNACLKPASRRRRGGGEAGLGPCCTEA